MGAAELRRQLMTKTRWSKHSLSARVQNLRKVTPMTTQTAQAILAHLRGIRIDRYLKGDALAEVQRILPLVNGAAAAAAARMPPASPRDGATQPSTQRRADARHGAPAKRVQSGATKGGSTPAGRRLVFPDKFEYADPILPDAKLLEAREMAAVYPMLYVLENSMRELIKRILWAKYGEYWWDTALTSGKAKQAKQKADSRHLGEEHMRWHQRRGAHPIDYTDLSNLGEIILAKRDDFFPDVLGGGDSLQWFEQFMRELEPSRNVVCHMNPLDAHNLTDITVKLTRWRQMVERWADTSKAAGR